MYKYSRCHVDGMPGIIHIFDSQCKFKKNESVPRAGKSFLATDGDVWHARLYRFYIFGEGYFGVLKIHICKCLGIELDN